MCRQFIVSGRVQGVFFRDATRTEANLRGVAGHAQNLQNGTVQISLCGCKTDLDEMINWLSVGPPLAAVDYVTEESVACRRPIGFKIA